MKEIKLTQGKFAQVDDEDFEWINQWKWYAQKSNKYIYAARYSKGKYYYMHRVIMNPDLLHEVDHKDRNGLNNQKNNLRICSHQQNAMNSKSREGSSKYIGVCYKDKYITAQIVINNKTIHLGYFKTEEDAAFARDLKAKELFGEFANLNFPVME
jgi:hypothetical protein